MAETLRRLGDLAPSELAGPMLGFLDVFRSLMILILILLPVIIFMNSGKGASGGMGH